MNQDRCAGMWKQFAGKVKEHWGKLTNDPLVRIAGTHDQRAGRIQEQLGVSKDESALQLKEFFERNRDWYISVMAEPTQGPQPRAEFSGRHQAQDRETVFSILVAGSLTGHRVMRPSSSSSFIAD